MHEAKTANSDDLLSTNFIRTGHVTQCKISFLTKAYFITSDNRKRKMRLTASVTAEIFKIKNCSLEICSSILGQKRNAATGFKFRKFETELIEMLFLTFSKFINHLWR